MSWQWTFWISVTSGLTLSVQLRSFVGPFSLLVHRSFKISFGENPIFKNRSQPTHKLLCHKVDDLVFVRLEVVVSLGSLKVLKNDWKEHVDQDEDHAYTAEEEHHRAQDPISSLQANITELAQHDTDQGVYTGDKGVLFQCTARALGSRDGKIRQKPARKWFRNEAFAPQRISRWIKKKTCVGWSKIDGEISPRWWKLQRRRHNRTIDQPVGDGGDPRILEGSFEKRSSRVCITRTW